MGWVALRRTVVDLWREIWGDRVPMVSAALAYYGLFGLLPALAAAAALWGQVGAMGALHAALREDGGLLPKGIAPMLDQFVGSIPRGFGGGLGLAVNLGLVVLTCCNAASGLITALNVVYERPERRGWLHLVLLALAVGLGGVVLLFCTLALAAAPLLAGPFGALETLARWPALGAIFMLALLVLLRYGPDRSGAPDRVEPLWRLVAGGTLVSAVLCVATSALMSLYLGNLANLGRLYGSLGGVAGVLLWFYASAFAILTGAELDSVLTIRAAGRAPRHAAGPTLDGAGPKP